MIVRTFDELIARMKLSATCRKMAVAAAGDEHTLQAVCRAKDTGLVEPILVGDAGVIEQILKDLGHVADFSIVDAADSVEASRKAVALVREGKADFLMKGKTDTKVVLKAVVDKEHGLGTGKLMSHVALFEVPGYHKLLAPVDGGMVPYPTLEQKKEIIENTVAVFNKMGYECPKVGVLACVEKVNPKMIETVDAHALKEMNQKGEIQNCIVDGPISYDCAMDKEIADMKGFSSPVAGDVDILLAPNIHTGNIMGKMLSVTCKARMAGFVVGASCPVVLSSRGASAEEKYLSILISSLAV
ncbi:MAG: phosphate butyryltransferase [Spirochaetia bacterium]|jgi:phosphate butyryltransferase|nr:phosphate butyryltransferase [Spirochaetia bacterium]